MRLAFLHPDDYAKALAGGCKPFDASLPVTGDELRVCTDSFYEVAKGECEMWTLPDYMPPGVRLVWKGDGI
jgi:hypothetical protein